MQEDRVEILNKKIKPKPSIVFDTYWRLAAERQEIFFRRIEGQMPPWTNDLILKLFKFTNAYRASDRASQYLIQNVIYSGDQDPSEVFFRIILFKLFNKIETWEAIKNGVDEIRYKTYNYDAYNGILDEMKLNGKAIYSGAYIMASGKEAFGHVYKHRNHLKMLESMLQDRVPEEIQNITTMEGVYNRLLAFPTIGTFLSYQLAIDVNYSNLTDFSEMDFVKAGPGAKDGIRKCFKSLGDYSEEDIIRMMAENQELEFQRLGINFKNLWGRPLQLIDCQNLFCEVDKYSRVAHPEIDGISDRKRIKQKFRPISLKPMKYAFPPKWHVNVPE